MFRVAFDNRCLKPMYFVSNIVVLASSNSVQNEKDASVADYHLPRPRLIDKLTIRVLEREPRRGRVGDSVWPWKLGHKLPGC